MSFTSPALSSSVPLKSEIRRTQGRARSPPASTERRLKAIVPGGSRKGVGAGAWGETQSLFSDMRMEQERMAEVIIVCVLARDCEHIVCERASLFVLACLRLRCGFSSLYGMRLLFAHVLPEGLQFCRRHAHP